MDGYRKQYMAIKKEDYDKAEPILNLFYNRGDIDRITVEYGVKSDAVLVGLECSTDDLLDIQKTMRQVGINVV